MVIYSSMQISIKNKKYIINKEHNYNMECGLVQRKI